MDWLSLLCVLFLASTMIVVPYGAQAADFDLAEEQARLITAGYQVLIHNELTLLLNGVPTGEASSVVLHNASDEVAYVFLSADHYELSVQGLTMRMAERHIYRANAAFEMLSFLERVETDAVLSVEGHRSADGKTFDVELVSAGATSRSKVPNDPPLSAPDLVLLRWIRSGLRPDFSASGQTYVALTNSIRPFTVQIVSFQAGNPDTGEPDLYTAETRLVGTTTTTVVQSDGTVRRARMDLGGLVFESVPRDSHVPAVAVATLPAVDVLRSTLVHVNHRFTNPRKTEALVVRLENLPNPDLVIEDHWQRALVPFAGGTVTLSVTCATEPVVGQPLAALAAHDWPKTFSSQCLEPTLHIQSDHPRIRAKAIEIIGDATQARDAALAIAEWCFRSIRSFNRLTVPTALEVLTSLQGDCNEHATLFAALARAVGIPTRICIGMVYSDELGAFGYHAWNECLVAVSPVEVWLPIDCTLNGPERVDATHIKLLQGDISDWLDLVPVFGSLRIEVLEERP